MEENKDNLVEKSAIEDEESHVDTPQITPTNQSTVEQENIVHKMSPSKSSILNKLLNAGLIIGIIGASIFLV